ncbi:MAG: hypothetical protein HYU66_24180 [Armatimonadetes bacterium]|nr:hypothetical protein [Armatimonadota bacterium]
MGEMLADKECWAALSCLSLRLYGVPLAKNGRPFGEVLTHMEAGSGRIGTVHQVSGEGETERD